MTGGVASGKSEALAALGRVGVSTVSADQLVHDLLDREPLRSEIEGRWGPAVVVDGRVDRQAVGSRVFTDRDELEWLESKVHPLVREEIASWVAGVDSGVAVVEVPLLFESNLHDRFDTTVAIVTDDAVRTERAGARGQAGLAGREERQLSQEQKAGMADHVIVNDGTVEELENALEGLLSELGFELPPRSG